jgi:hypothetical protein
MDETDVRAFFLEWHDIILQNMGFSLLLRIQQFIYLTRFNNLQGSTAAKRGCQKREEVFDQFIYIAKMSPGG